VEESERCGMFYVVNRWLGGTLTNFQTIKKSIARLKELEQMKEDGSINRYTKKEILKMDKEQVVVTVEKYGNTSAASIPMAINDIYESGRLKKGEMMLLDTFGGGLTWASALAPFAGSSYIEK
jgi:ribosomal protein S2